MAMSKPELSSREIDNDPLPAALYVSTIFRGSGNPPIERVTYGSSITIIILSQKELPLKGFC
jgi:hypothetical protein